MSAVPCPNCGVSRRGITRRCHECGYDFWAAAAGSAQPIEVVDRSEPQVDFLPDETDAAAQPPGWWERRSRRQKGAIIGGAAFVLLLGIGNDTGDSEDDGVVSNVTPSPTTAAATNSPTERPTPEPTKEPGQAPLGATTIALVVDVVDGDTIRVEVDGEVFSVRYIGIDTPETVHPTVPVEWMGLEASAENAALVEGKEVVLEKDVSEVDQFDRLLRYVWVQQGTGWLLVNYELVLRGFANSATYPPDVLYQELLIEAEREARNSDRGLWGPSPTPAPTSPPMPVPTAAPTPVPPAAAAIVVCDGNMDAPGNDNYAENLNGEYIVICNTGSVGASLGGWRVHDNDANHTYLFPAISLGPDASVALYSGTGANSSTALFWGNTYGAVWNNDGDCAFLYNSAATLVSNRCF